MSCEALVSLGVFVWQLLGRAVLYASVSSYQIDGSVLSIPFI